MTALEQKCLDERALACANRNAPPSDGRGRGLLMIGFRSGWKERGRSDSEQMRERAVQALTPYVKPDNSLFHMPGEFVEYHPGSESVRLDGSFELEQLEAIVWWMKGNKDAT